MKSTFRILCSFSLLVTVACFNASTFALGVAGGVYNDYAGNPKGSSALLLIQSTSVSNGKVGSDWAAVKVEDTLSPNTFSSSVSTTSIHKNSIVVSGDYFKQPPDPADFHYSSPFIIVSKNGGSDWSRIDLGDLFNDPNVAGEVSGSACNNQGCVISGNYTLTPPVSRVPFLLVQPVNDVAGVWQRIDLKEQGGEFVFDDGDFTGGVACASDFCISGGSLNGYFTEGSFATLPLVAVLNQNLKTVSIVKTYAISGLESIINGAIFTVACNSDTCLAAGSMHLSGDYSVYHPMILVSKKKSQDIDWVNIDTSNIAGSPTVDPDLHDMDGYLVSAACFDNTCVVGGAYAGRALLYWTAGGDISKSSNWHYTELSDISNHIKNVTAVVCSSRRICIASVLVEGASVAFYRTIDAGAHWKFMDINPLMPADFYEGEIYGLSCTASFCTASGRYFPSPGSSSTRSMPLLLTSQDSGATWLLVDVPHVRGLDTVSITTGAFSGNSSSSAQASVRSAILRRNLDK